MVVGDTKLDVIFMVGMEGRVEDADGFSILQEPDVFDGANDVGAPQRISVARSEQVLA